MLTPSSVSHEERAYLATLRPSRIREVQAGSNGWICVDLIDIESGEAVALRGVLELFGVRVRRFPVGQARHLVRALGGETNAPYVVLACHGDAGRVLLPELADELERFQPLHGSIGPDELRQVAKLSPGSVVTAPAATPARRNWRARTSRAALRRTWRRPARRSATRARSLHSCCSTSSRRGRPLERAVERLRDHDRELSMWRLVPP